MKSVSDERRVLREDGCYCVPYKRKMEKNSSLWAIRQRRVLCLSVNKTLHTSYPKMLRLHCKKNGSLKVSKILNHELNLVNVALKMREKFQNLPNLRK